MKPKRQLVEVAKRQIGVDDKALIGCALAWNQGRGYARLIFQEDILEEMEEWDKFHRVSEFVTDFCLDYLSGKIPPNQLINALSQISKNCARLNARRRKRRK